jgi:hypothetical protein
MTATCRERIINTCITLAIVVMFLMLALKISFNYTRKYYERSNIKQDIFIEKLDYLIQKIDSLNAE